METFTNKLIRKIIKAVDSDELLLIIAETENKLRKSERRELKNMLKQLAVSGKANTTGLFNIKQFLMFS